MKDIFVYGCDPRLSWKASDAEMPIDNSPALDAIIDDYDTSFRELAEVMHSICLPFSKEASEWVKITL